MSENGLDLGKQACRHFRFRFQW